MAPTGNTKLSEAIGDLTTIAVAALVGGAGPAATAATAAGVKRLKAMIDSQAERKRLQSEAESTISAWGHGEGFSDDELITGLAIARDVVEQHGPSDRELGQSRLNATTVADRIVGKAKQRAADAGSSWADADWGDSEHAIAREALRATYEYLIQRYYTSHQVFVGASEAALREEVTPSLNCLEAGNAAIERYAHGLHARLVAQATRKDLIVYLEARVDDWDRSSFVGDRQTVLEQRLSLEQGDGGSDSHRQASATPTIVSSEEALAGASSLVILGGPGSGKSWLARRYAREAAQAALESLRNGADPTEVEIPILTTWSFWAPDTSGDPRTSLVEASFDSRLGLSDLGGAERIDGSSGLWV